MQLETSGSDALFEATVSRGLRGVSCGDSLLKGRTESDRGGRPRLRSVLV